jgi:hypothetical protein
MEKGTAIAVITAELTSLQDKTCIEEIIYSFICERGIDDKTIRNKCIKSDFNKLYKTNLPIMQIYSDLSATYNISEDSVRYIMRGK